MKPVKLTNEQIGSFCTALEHLIHAGIGLGDALVLLAEDEKELSLGGLLQSMAKAADGGATLADAMEQSGLFPRDAVHMVRVGERTGRVEESLAGLADYYDRMDEVERHLRSALCYPSVLFAAMTAVLLLLGTKVLPMFFDLYESLGGAVNGLAGVLFAVGEVLSPWVPLFWCLLLLFAGGMIAITTVPGLRRRLTDRIFCGQNGAGKALRQAQFARALAMAVHSGLPGAEAVECAAEMLEHRPDSEERCRQCLAAIAEGRGFADAIGEAGLLPETECRLLTLGLAGGSGERAAEEVARRLERESEDAMDKTVSRLEPALVVISSLLVGGILLAVLLPLVDLMNTLTY